MTPETVLSVASVHFDIAVLCFNAAQWNQSLARCRARPSALSTTPTRAASTARSVEQVIGGTRELLLKWAGGSRP